MASANELIENAFERLRERPGFVERVDQVQLALFLSDLIEGRSSGAIEAPTGLGKSLAALIPAIAHAIVSGKRTIIATYTNVLAEQYWRKDLPLALSLFEDGPLVKSAFLIGRQRYVCLASMDEVMPTHRDGFQSDAELGVESEFRSFIRKPAIELNQLWQKVATPPVCPGRLCPAYDDCFYYSARKQAERASIVITNHSVVIQDSIMAQRGDTGEALLGKFDFLLLDEGHDFIQAAQNGLEFEVSESKVAMVQAIAGRLESTLRGASQTAGDEASLAKLAEKFRQQMDRHVNELKAYSLALRKTGILTAAPAELLEHPQVKLHQSKDAIEDAEVIASAIGQTCRQFTEGLNALTTKWSDEKPESARPAIDSVRNYQSFVRDFGEHAIQVVCPIGVSVSHVGQDAGGARLRQDIVGLSEPLDEMIWQRTPYALLSATLAVDGGFDFIRRTLGIKPDFEEILPTPFDYAHQAALYVPKAGTIPDPTQARKEGTESLYYDALAREVKEIILAAGGRTLALFHSRKEMEEVASRMSLPDELPIFMQFKSGAASVGERFKKNIRASLFALRSFWTGFDAPGETLSCVILVRVPFEVPVEPSAIARLAYLQTKGEDPFQSWTLPMAKMMIRQGAGRLIRTAEDKGVIALLDPRLRLKRYGEEIIANLPNDMRTFDDIGDAVGWIGLECDLPSPMA